VISAEPPQTGKLIAPARLRKEPEAGQNLAGGTGAYICDQCIELCNEVHAGE